MASPHEKTCRTGPYFSSPRFKIDGEKSGTYYANNALWFKNNRFFLSQIGDEKLKCGGWLMFDRNLTNCFVTRTAVKNVVNCTDFAPDWFNWHYWIYPFYKRPRLW